MPKSYNLRRIKTRVGSIAYSDSGSGMPVLFWPSLFSDHRLYSHVQRLLGDQWRVITVDGPGFGQSDAPNGDVQPDIYADVIPEVLDALKIEKAMVAGCSWGGQIAAHVGVKAPSRIQGVLIMNSPLGPSLGGHFFEIFGTRWFGSTEFWGNGVARSMFSQPSQKNHPERLREFVSAFLDFDPKAAATTARTVLTKFPGLQDVLPRLTVPTAILMGEDDKLYPVARMKPFAQLATSARLKIVPQCGHLTPLEAPEAVVASLEELLNMRS